MAADIDAILREALRLGASDVHLAVELPPMLRVNGELRPVQGMGPLTPEDTEVILQRVASADQVARVRSVGEADFSYSLASTARFRVNAYRQRGSVSLALRAIPSRVPSLEELGIPEVVASLSRRPNGLILVTGRTGSGKSTTLAAMVDLMNSERSLHIVTLEDPIEYLHRHKRSIVNQREIGLDSQSFAGALRAALRQDPDVILVGEMRDLETIAIALTAAETGHLVLATLHTPDAAQSIDRIIDAFPPNQQEQVRIQLAGTLQGVIAQVLLPRADRPGRVAAFEILVATPAVRNLIREGKTHQIPSLMETGSRYGMRTLESSLRELLDRGAIRPEDYRIYLPAGGLGSAGARAAGEPGPALPRGGY